MSDNADNRCKVSHRTTRTGYWPIGSLATAAEISICTCAHRAKFIGLADDSGTGAEPLGRKWAKRSNCNCCCGKHSIGQSWSAVFTSAIGRNPFVLSHTFACDITTQAARSEADIHPSALIGLAMDHPALHVSPGDTLQLQFVADTEPTRPRLGVTVIGLISGRSLLVSHPHASGRLLLVRDGEPVACRMFSDGTMLGFKTTVRKVVTHPEAYLHLDYPKALEQRVLRLAPRVAVDLASRFRPLGNTHSHIAHIDDLSLRGCRVTTLRAEVAIGDTVELTADAPIGDTEHQLTLRGTVRNISHAEPEQHCGGAGTYGVEFSPMPVEDAVWLRAYLYDQLHGETREPLIYSHRQVAA